jgi:signal transduction histidine kinase
MTSAGIRPLATELADRLRQSREDLARRWLERISARVTLSPNRVFPSDELLNHIPLLIDGMAAYLEGPGEDLDAEGPVTAKARELGALRHAQGFDAYEILKEHELLGGIVLTFLTDTVEEIDLTYERRELLECWHRITDAVELIRQATAQQFLQLSAERVREREERLRRFNRMVSHELKNRVGAIRGAAGLLGETWLGNDERDRFIRMVKENAAGLQQVLENLEQLSRLDVDARQQRNVLLPQAVAEVVRQTRDAAQSRDVQVRVAPDLPAVEVNAAAVELCLTNYLTNAIKYSDGSRDKRWVSITGELVAPGVSAVGGELIVRVRDNGIGVPTASRARLFQQFYRAHGETVTGVEGTGLGLSIVRETVESLGGRAWAEFPEDGGTLFAFALPSRREEDAAAAGVMRY